MAKNSAGLLLYKKNGNGLLVLLAHPGGPFYSRKDAGSWTIPKGEFEENEDPLSAALREFEEETGLQPVGDFLPLTPQKQPSRKIVHAWALESDIDTSTIKSNTFQLEWPPKSGKQQEFPEIDRAEWFTLEQASVKILPGQRPFLDELSQLMGIDTKSSNAGATSKPAPPKNDQNQFDLL